MIWELLRFHCLVSWIRELRKVVGWIERLWIFGIILNWDYSWLFRRLHSSTYDVYLAVLDYVSLIIQIHILRHSVHILLRIGEVEIHRGENLMRRSLLEITKSLVSTLVFERNYIREFMLRGFLKFRNWMLQIWNFHILSISSRRKCRDFWDERVIWIFLSIASVCLKRSLISILLISRPLIPHIFWWTKSFIQLISFIWCFRTFEFILWIFFQILPFQLIHVTPKRKLRDIGQTIIIRAFMLPSKRQPPFSILFVLPNSRIFFTF